VGPCHGSARRPHAADAFGDVGAAWATIIARTLVSIPSHWISSGIFGAGLVWFIGRPDVQARKGLGAGLMLTAMLMHGLSDASSAIAVGGTFAWIVQTTVACVLTGVFVWAYKSTVPVEREWMRELMAPEVQLGVVTPAELDALAGSRSTLRSYLRTQPSRGRATHVLDAERELAHQIACDGGAATAAVQDARTAVAQARTS
jgi:protease PrsW